jgi:hypothetical protein
VLAREKNGHWEVYLENGLSEILELGNGRWVAVPEDVILKRENLDGRPIACRTSYGTIRCFVPPPET